MSNEKYIPSFTIFEITMVMAIMGVIITIVTISMTRFNEQLKMTGDVNQELNDWYAFRSNLWNELYTMDSVRMKEQHMFLYTEGKEVVYRVEDESFQRRMGENWIETGQEVSSLRLDEQKDGTHVVFDFEWKGETMTIDYLYRPDVRTSINAYFDQLK